MDARHLSLDDVRDYCRQKLRIVDHTLDDAELETRCPLDNGRHVIHPKTSVGQLDLLPVELIYQVLGLLDIPTLTTFRRVNQRAMHLVDSLPPYRRLWTSCPDIFRAVVSINAASFSCEALSQALTREKCESCSLFGGYLYLITCKRVCYFCFTTRKKYFPVSSTLAARQAKLQKKTLSHLPHVLSLPGRYTAVAKLSRYRVTLVDRPALLHLSEEAATLNKRIDYATTEPRRYMSIIAAPHLSLQSQRAYWGLFCSFCRDNTEPSRHFRIQYNQQDIVQHFKDYHAAQISRSPP
ncbi:hypothetical protein B0T22DRAFT_456100 [Podospora appendiculata]|uniref:F-box domain-containing protein n=1 Tax=Podospora appendiculata TaxID=314037 RepID=A0AAE1CIX5_9PEZI|nr:hypothetical protein B0T22DRAFT_456100 [Podospora appendiculata]